MASTWDSQNGIHTADSATKTTPEMPFPVQPKPSKPATKIEPSLPPAIDSVRSHTADEIVQMMKKTPLFMTNLDDGEDDEPNIELEAIRALQYEGTRAEVALGFKERGNEMVKEKRWKDAKEFYTKGIAALKQMPQDQKHGEQQVQRQVHGGQGSKNAQEPEEAEIAQERKVEEACYVNRALCNLELPRLA
ncbi:MAG: hypothetical protein Q9174_003935 [Haloplaca sp. 1 TL-2023]